MSFGNDPKPHLNIQRVLYLQRLVVLIDAGILNIESDWEPLKRFMQWLDAWDVKRKQHALPILDDLKERYPAPGLWDIAQFEE